MMTLMTYNNVLRLTRQLELREQLRLLEDLAQLVRQQVEVPRTRSIMELEGLGAEIWQGIDAQEYVNKERASWDS
jgi:hypothetical protein